MTIRLFAVEIHSHAQGWVRLPGFLAQLKHARDASLIYSQQTGRTSRTTRCSKRQSEGQTPIDVENWLLLNDITGIR